MLRLKIVSPEKVLYDGQAVSVKVPGMMGRMEILQNHAPLISVLVAGKVEYALADSTKSIDINGGFIEVQKNTVSLCIERNAQ